MRKPKGHFCLIQCLTSRSNCTARIFESLWGTSPNSPTRFQLPSVPYMMYRHPLNLEHHVRRRSRELARKLPRLLLAEEHVLVLHLAAQPLLTLPNHLPRAPFLLPLYHWMPDRLAAILNRSCYPLLIDIDIFRVDYTFVLLCLFVRTGCAFRRRAFRRGSCRSRLVHRLGQLVAGAG